MYEKILVTLDGTPTDRAIIDHIKQLAKIMGSRVVLLHVCDGWAAHMHGSDAVGPEMREDRIYVDRIRAELQASDIVAEAELAYGDPAEEIVRWVEVHGCDLVAMSTHGHRLLGDLFLGETASYVRHRLSVPVLMLRAQSHV